MRKGKSTGRVNWGRIYGKHWDPFSWGELCNARTTCTNSSGLKPDLGLDQDQQ